MFALLKTYFDIAFLMGKPQDLPGGENQLFTAVVLNFITYVLALTSFTGFGSAVLHAATDIVFSGICLYLGLMFVGRLPRFQQAFGALCGAGSILNLAALPLLTLTMVPNAGETNSIALFSHFLLLVWSLSLVGHVLRHTFSIKMLASIVIAYVYYRFISIVLALVVPVEVASNLSSGELSVIQPLAAIWLQIA